MVSTDRKKIFIPFIEGTLNYDCRECGYFCCQNGLITMNPSEKGTLLQKYPYLKYFCHERTKKKYAVKKFTRCWFLKTNGLCYIHEKYGYSSKPFQCRLHPFYVVRCRDEYIVIRSMCRFLRVDRGSKNISHKQILRSAAEAIDFPYILGKINWSAKRLKLEKMILQRSKEFLENSTYVEFSACQIALERGTKSTSALNKELLERLELWKSFLGVEGLSMEDKKLTYELTLLTSVLRVETALAEMDESKVPLALLALYLNMILYFKVNKVRTYVDTYQQILEDIPIGLVRLKKNDLSLKKKSIETRLEYLRTLGRIPSSLQRRRRKS